MATLLTPRENLFPTDELPMVRAGTTTNPLDRAQPVAGTGYLRIDGPAAERKHPASYVRGVSLSGVLQMLHLERKTCVLEVTGPSAYGTLTLVNGELVDADADPTTGEEAVYRILSWQEPQTLILDGVSLFRHTINTPLAQLLVEAVRRQDEGIVFAGETTGDASGIKQARASDWTWLVETLIISGASFAAVVDGVNETVLAAADEAGGLAHGAPSEPMPDVIPAIQAARQWSRLFDEEVDELVLRLGERQVLVEPLDQERTHHIYAELSLGESLELVRSAIRSLRR